jgi:hypothetical protein
MFGRKFTQEEDAFLIANYLTMPCKRMAKQLGRADSVARQRLTRLGITVPPEVAERFRQASYIKAGHTPMNKGRKQSEYMSKDMIAKTAATRFKKGDLPHNTKEANGELSIRKDTKTGIDYVYIRVSIGVWQLYQRYQYEKFIGKIPAGCVVILKDGNPNNCHPFNLELISKKENMQRNTIHRYPQDLIQTMKVLSKLKKKIKNYGSK